MRVPLAILAALLPIACTGPTLPTAERERTTIDTLDFVVGEANTWPRVGGQAQHQVVDPLTKEVCWIKYGNPRMFECWRWDDEWIYHRVDHGIDGGTGESYELTDGRWLPRRLSGDWFLEVPANRIRWFDPLCQLSASKSRALPYHVRAWIEPARFLGTDLGTREVLMLEYTPDPGSASGYSERFSFARGAGWFAWENPRGPVRFDRFGGPRRLRASACGEGSIGGAGEDTNR